MSYNGWKNYETWAVALWLDNEQGSQSYWQNRGQEAWDDAKATSYATQSEVAAANLAETLKQELEEGNPLEQASLYCDLLTAAMSEVDWHEVAEHYLPEDRAEQAEEAEETA